MKGNQKILLLITLSEWGGAQHVVYQLARSLRSHYEVTVACAPDGPFVRRLRDRGIDVVEIPEMTRYVNPFQDPRVFFKLYRWMRREGFRVVHTHSTKAGLLGRMAARLAGVPVIVFTAHGWAFAKGRAYWKRWLIAQAEKLAAKMTTRILCVSHYDKQLALDFRVARPEQLTVIHNGLDPRPFLEAAGARLRKELVGSSGPILTFVGRLALQKDPLTLLKAMTQMTRGKLVIVGDGPLKHKVRRFIHEKALEGRVLTLGEREDIPEILAASDLFVLPSRWEGLPLTIIEAMMTALPVIASRVGGVPELVEDGVTGVLVPPRNPAALAQAIQKLLEDRELCWQMGQAGREKVLQGFTQERMLAEIQRLYAELLATDGQDPQAGVRHL